MKIKFISVFVFVIFSLMLLKYISGQIKESEQKKEYRNKLNSIKVYLKEANDKFTYKGKPINPMAIQDLVTSLSDSYPTTVALDMEGVNHSNRYRDDFTKEKDDFIKISYDKDGYFSYKRIGTLTNNFHVIETVDDGGGSQTYINFLLIKFDLDSVYDLDGSLRYRVVMSCKGEIESEEIPIIKGNKLILKEYGKTFKKNIKF